MMCVSDKKIFLDMDGVLVDFVGGVLKLHDLDPELANTFKGEYDINQHLKMDPTEFWSAIDKEPDFWAKLEPTKDSDKIVKHAFSLVSPANVYLLTSPSRHPHCYSGKAAWVQFHYPRLSHRLILTAHKHLLSHRNHLLVDDSDRNIKQFQKAGGRTILYPRPWNSKHLFSAQAFNLFEKEARRFV